MTRPCWRCWFEEEKTTKLGRYLTGEGEVEEKKEKKEKKMRELGKH
jgi:hypothetical protein